MPGLHQAGGLSRKRPPFSNKKEESSKAARRHSVFVRSARDTKLQRVGAPGAEAAHSRPASEGALSANNNVRSATKQFRDDQRPTSKIAFPKSGGVQYPHSAVGTTPRKHLPQHLEPPQSPKRRDLDVMGTTGGVSGRSQNALKKQDLTIREGETLEQFVQRNHDILDFDAKGLHEVTNAALNFEKAGTIRRFAGEADRMTQKEYPSGLDWNSEADAFRHALWMFKIVDEYGANAAKKFGDAHERYQNFEPEDTIMDLFNNQVARDLATDPRNAGRNPVDVIKEAIKEGRFIISTSELTNRRIDKLPPFLNNTEKFELYLKRRHD